MQDLSCWQATDSGDILKIYSFRSMKENLGEQDKSKKERQKAPKLNSLRFISSIYLTGQAPGKSAALVLMKFNPEPSAR